MKSITQINHQDIVTIQQEEREETISLREQRKNNVFFSLFSHFSALSSEYLQDI